MIFVRLSHSQWYNLPPHTSTCQPLAVFVSLSFCCYHIPVEIFFFFLFLLGAYTWCERTIYTLSKHCISLNAFRTRCRNRKQSPNSNLLAFLVALYLVFVTLNLVCYLVTFCCLCCALFAWVFLYFVIHLYLFIYFFVASENRNCVN